ncbi:glutamate 5-kinase [Paludibacterium purpuratum]|uniref:Glutamate 5-kinase n=1 Tax=Paludibacterium purpuratum TaxID=1144873 RepID=A0A4R7B6J6_9NEIS|nr:glutamate 5-kinase [Paludibacterium purpuratum]TDR80324.1 glutamate 5-kinase [Paludibacterium purpuratum]
MHSVIHSASRIVVKVGSSLVTNDGKGLDLAALGRWAEEISELKRRGKQVVLVSSGAIAEGCQRLGWATRPKSVDQLQAAAAVGQMGLCQAYESAFRAFGLGTAQILLTHEDLADRTRYLNARSTLTTLLNLNVVPIINENDTVVTDEIRLGDNDTLGALVTNLIEADALVILTDQIGLFSADPRKDPQARLIEDATAGDPQLEDMAGGAGSKVGTGGMLTKILAAKRAAHSGAHTVIACGREPHVLSRLADGEHIGTQLQAVTSRLAARKQWLADHLKLSGRITVDAGAARAIGEKGTSLLPIGVVSVEGDFLRGEAVACIDPQGHELARGLVNYSSDEARQLIKVATRDIETVLGYIGEPELIHRDNMVLANCG